MEKWMKRVCFNENSKGWAFVFFFNFHKLVLQWAYRCSNAALIDDECMTQSFNFGIRIWKLLLFIWVSLFFVPWQWGILCKRNGVQIFRSVTLLIFVFGFTSLSRVEREYDAMWWKSFVFCDESDEKLYKWW